MKELGATQATVAATTTALVAPAFGIDPAVVIGAISGAGIFIMSAEGKGAIKRLILFFSAVACGFLGAQFAAKLLALVVPASVPISQGVGAIVAASVSVRVLQRLIEMVDSPLSLQALFKGKKE